MVSKGSSIEETKACCHGGRTAQSFAELHFAKKIRAYQKKFVSFGGQGGEEVELVRVKLDNAKNATIPFSSQNDDEGKGQGGGNYNRGGPRVGGANPLQRRARKKKARELAQGQGF